MQVFVLFDEECHVVSPLFKQMFMHFAFQQEDISAIHSDGKDGMSDSTAGMV